MNYINCLVFVFVLNLVIMKGNSKLYKPMRRVIGGLSVRNNREFPFIVFITLHNLQQSSIIPEDNDSFCTGTILNPKHILTAAHCVLICSSIRIETETTCLESTCQYTDIKRFSVLTGNTAVKKAKSRAGVARASAHPEYKMCDTKEKCIMRYDIAILELDIFLHFTNKVMSVHLPEPVDITDSPLSTVHKKYKECVILGWGRYTDDDNLKASDRKLRKAKIQLIDHKECRKHINLGFDDWEDSGLCKDTSMCTFDLKHLNGICNGDSGGPLICNGTQVGVVSWSATPDKKSCARNNIPDVYSRTDINVVWINEIMANAPGVKRFIPTELNDVLKAINN